MAHGYRRPLPKSLGPETQALIIACWAQDARDRPSMPQVLERLQEIERAGGPGSGGEAGGGASSGGVGHAKQHAAKGCCSCTIS